MKAGDFTADLDLELAKAKTGGCWYCETVRVPRPDVDEAITSKLEAFPNQKPWVAIARVLERNGFDGASKSKVMGHFQSADRARHGF
jgi:hypothetical protein